ncbi:MAG TPA: YfhO family protein [Blastocatellia bacterium]|nr:YfhO family protein [Blastocatellia bacterium]HMV87466.1 YfhO family protein [Blastocatellia bacterium]HNG33535.1 YfhO family protein [Blastocatellia bacterium]
MIQILKTTSDRLSRVGVALTLVLLPLIYFFPAALGKVTLAPGDGWTQILGIRVLIGQMLAGGEWPLWNPYIFAGMPLLAAIQPGALYPPTWLFAVLSPQWAMNLLVLMTYHLALIGTYLFARRIGINRIGALIAGATFTFGGFMVAHLGHTNRINAAAWLPWILLAVESCWANCQFASFAASEFAAEPAQKNLSRNRRLWRWVTLGAVFIALQMFAGEPQMTFYTALVAAAYVLFTVLFRECREGRARFLATLTAMVLCGGLLSMIQLLPERELLQLGDRATIDYRYFSQFSFPPRQILELFFPYFFGGAALAPYRVPYWGAWNPTETLGYVGMSAWLLALAAVFSVRRNHKDDANRQIKFWAAVALTALLLAFGAYLPFNSYRLLHRLPVYNLFRASGRHLLEFTFALGMLAGLGVTAPAQLERAAARRIVIRSIAVLAATVAASAAVYRFFAQRLVTDIQLPPQAGAWSNPEFYFPVAFFGLSVAALLMYARRWAAPSGIGIVVVLFLDLMAFGFFYEWRAINHDTAARLADPPTVKFIKQREPDWNSFRVVSQSPAPYGSQQDLLDYPNISIARGLQSVNGYDPLRLGQMAEVAGRMTLDGVIEEPTAVGAAHQGFNLLNAKYLLREHPNPAHAQQTIEIEGSHFADKPLQLALGTRVRAQFAVQAMADELVVVSALENAAAISAGTPVLNIKLHAAAGQTIEHQLLVGRDTAAWMPDSSAPIAAWNAVGFRGKGYLARLKFARAEIEQIELESLLEGNAQLLLTRASFFDSETKAAHPLEVWQPSPERWHKLAEFGEVEIYENLKTLPRAWFAPRAVVAPSVEVLQIIKSGRLKDGADFDPATTVLLESELFANRQLKTPAINSGATELPKAEVKVTSYRPNRIEVQTNNPAAGFLVLSEIYYRGWEARVDGQRASVDRVDFALRGVELPPGQHTIEFNFRAHSFRNGAAWSVVGLALLCISGVLVYRKRK